MEIHISVDGRLTVLEGHRIAKAAEKRITEQTEDIGSVIVHVDPAEMEA
jgi:divalent metal cation (Fe/Co/Zn/Cd) transporter